MRTKDLLLGFLASAFLVGCSQNEDAPGGGEDKNGAEDSYVSVKIRADRGLSSRATDANNFADATETEGNVTSGHFFFFDENGNSIAVNGNNNYQQMGLSEIVDTDKDYVESYVDAVVVLEKPKTIPSKMVVVLNWNYNEGALSLDDLAEKLVSDTDALNSTSGFVMSNSVYYNEKIMNATAVTAANFASSPALAKENAVEAHVERLAVKVTASLKIEDNNKYDTTIGAFDTGVSYKQENKDVKIYAEILGWQLNTTNPESYMLKNIDASWGTKSPFTDWNESDKYRSYWGISSEPTGSYANMAFTWAGITDNISSNSASYCLENTAGTSTKAVFKAQLCTWDDTKKELAPVTIWQWYTKYYLSQDAMLADVVVQANAEIDKLSTDETYNLAATDITVDYATSTTSARDFYKVKFKLVSTKEDLAIGETGKKISDVLADIIHAKKWQDGATYYFTTIKHLNGEGAVIRNHAYHLLVTEVVGLGTPGNKPDNDGETPDPEPTIPEPVDPGDTETYIAAKINVLSWRLVNNHVILGQ